MEITSIVSNGWEDGFNGWPDRPFKVAYYFFNAREPQELFYFLEYSFVVSSCPSCHQDESQRFLFQVAYKEQKFLHDVIIQRWV